jgi:hypothetical protein
VKGKGMKVSQLDALMIEFDISRITELIESGIFSGENQFSVFQNAVFIEILILLRNLMFMSSKYSARISFTDDIKISDTVKDVDSLIKYVRDAVCHPESSNHFLPNPKTIATFNFMFGKASIISGNNVYAGIYDDDVCVFFGEHGIYLKRHIIRAMNEAKSNLLPLLQQ